jgi:hypothetical protein
MFKRYLDVFRYVSICLNIFKRYLNMFKRYIDILNMFK